VTCGAHIEREAQKSHYLPATNIIAMKIIRTSHMKVNIIITTIHIKYLTACIGTTREIGGIGEWWWCDWYTRLLLDRDSDYYCREEGEECDCDWQQQQHLQ
jgi:hypothetical protein